MSAVVVRARFDSWTLDSVDAWPVKKGDLGVLRWKRHRRHARFLEACVVWDSDPTRRLRRVILSMLEVTGLQTSTCRVLLTRR